MAARGFDALDVVIVTGDGYVDHPSFGAAVIGRVLEARGFRVGILDAPRNWLETTLVSNRFGPAPSPTFTASGRNAMRPASGELSRALSSEENRVPLSATTMLLAGSLADRLSGRMLVRHASMTIERYCSGCGRCATPRSQLRCSRASPCS